MRLMLPTLLATVACNGDKSDTASDFQTIDTGNSDSVVGASQTGETGKPTYPLDSAVEYDTGCFPHPPAVSTDTGVPPGRPAAGPFEPDIVAAAKLIGENGGDTGLLNPDFAGGGLGIGDANGDGFDDVTVTSSYAHDPVTQIPGTVYVEKGPFFGHIDLSAADARFGAVLAIPLGDEDGDGLPDVLFNGGPDQSYDDFVVPGPALSGHVDPGDALFTVLGGRGIAGGDLDGDSISEVVLFGQFPGATISIVPGGTRTEVDHSMPLPTHIEASDPVTSPGLTGIVALGDLDADGLGDLATLWASGDALGYVSTLQIMAYSGPELTGSLTQSDASATFVVPADDAVFTGLSIPGDVDGDGYGDLAISTSTFPAAGELDVIYGPLRNCAPQLINNALGSIVGDSNIEVTGVGSAIGDFDQDGANDVGVKIRNATIAIVYGPVVGATSMSDAERTLFSGSIPEGDGIYGVAGAGDVNGDGLPDLLIGNPFDSEGGTDAGAAWLILGGFTP